MLCPLIISCRAITVLIIATAVPICSTAWGQISDSDRQQLVQEIERATTSLDPQRLPDLQEATRQLLNDIERLESVYANLTGPENAAAWLQYLDVQPLVEAIESDQPAAAQARTAMELGGRLVGVDRGLELSALRQLRESIDRFVAAVRFRDPERAIDAIRNQLKTLQERLESTDRTPTAEDAAAISAIAGILIDANQANALVSLLKQVFGHPNASIWISERAVQATLNRAVHETTPVRDCILDTRIVGTATLDGWVTADLVPSRGSARMRLTLNAGFQSCNVGYNGPVSLNTVGNGHVVASRMLSLSDSGVRLSEAYATASLNTRITSINHRLRLVRKIAAKRAAAQKPKAEQVAVEKLRQRVGQQFAEETNEAAAIEPPDMVAKTRPWLQRLALDEPAQQWGSTDHAIYIKGSVARTDQLLAGIAAPPVTGPFDAAIQIHESLVENAMAKLLAGRTVTQQQFDRLLQEIGRPASTSQDAADQDQEPPFEIDFARFRPLIFEARQQQVRLGIRGTRFEQGNRVLDRPLEITANYQPTTTADGNVILRRQGEVNIDFPGRQRLTLTQTALRSSIKTLFADVFPEQLLDRPFLIPNTVQLDALRGKNYRAGSIDSQNGWLSVTLRRAADQPASLAAR